MIVVVAAVMARNLNEILPSMKAFILLIIDMSVRECSERCELVPENRIKRSAVCCAD